VIVHGIGKEKADLKGVQNSLVTSVMQVANQALGTIEFVHVTGRTSTLRWTGDSKQGIEFVRGTEEANRDSQGGRVPRRSLKGNGPRSEGEGSR